MSSFLCSTIRSAESVFRQPRHLSGTSAGGLRRAATLREDRRSPSAAVRRRASSVAPSAALMSSLERLLPLWMAVVTNGLRAGRLRADRRRSPDLRNSSAEGGGARDCRRPRSPSRLRTNFALLPQFLCRMDRTARSGRRRSVGERERRRQAASGRPSPLRQRWNVRRMLW
jgi:hypothetical protein